MKEPEFNFNRKHALLDTNILDAFLGGKKSERYKEVISFLLENECQMYILKNATDFEFTGYHSNKKLYTETKGWLENNFIQEVPRPIDYENAAKLSSMYRCKNPSINPKQISFVDCLYAAQLLRVKERAFIVTTNLNDYPSFLFDMPKHFPVEDSVGQTSFVGIKTFNTSKLSALTKDFDKSGD